MAWRGAIKKTVGAGRGRTAQCEFGETQIIVFPNPARDRINIASNLRINAVLYNSIGQPVLQKTNVNQLDLSRFEAGIYNLILTYNDLQFTKKIIKQ